MPPDTELPEAKSIEIAQGIYRHNPKIRLNRIGPVPVFVTERLGKPNTGQNRVAWSRPMFLTKDSTTALTHLLFALRFGVTVPVADSNMSFDPADPRIDEGIRLFNDREFFECHDVFEDFWSEQIGPEKTFFQGLIHAAVCLFHFEGGNLGGARKMYGSCTGYLQPFEPEFCGIDVDGLTRDLKFCFEELIAATNEYPHGVTLRPERIPVIIRTSIQT